MSPFQLVHQDDNVDNAHPAAGRSPSPLPSRNAVQKVDLRLPPTNVASYVSNKAAPCVKEYPSDNILKSSTMDPTELRDSMASVESRAIPYVDSRLGSGTDRSQGSPFEFKLQGSKSATTPLSDSKRDSSAEQNTRDSSQDDRIPSPERRDNGLPREDGGMRSTQKSIADDNSYRHTDSDSNRAAMAFVYPILPETSRKHTRQDWHSPVQQPATYDLDDDENVIIKNASGDGMTRLVGNMNSHKTNSRRDVVAASGDKPLGLDISKFNQVSMII